METAKDILMGLESQLVKVILSKAQSGKYNKSVILPFDSNNNVVWQIQEFTDKQVFHKNTTFLNILQYVEQSFGSVFRQINIIATDCEYSGIVSKKGKVTFVKIKTTHKERNTLHNRVKNYILNEGDDIPILRDLGIFTAENKIVKSMYDKFKQVNRFVEMIDDALKSFHKSEITILDFGCGKSYLTFVVYYYLTMIKGLKANIIGYDIKQDVVENCNKLAQKYDYNGIKVILDYGHNIEGYKKVLPTLSRISSGNITGIIGVPGDRNDYVAREIGSISAKYLDKIIIKEDKDRRGRKSGEVPNLIKDGVLEVKKDANVNIVLDEVEALQIALNESSEGDIIIVFFERLAPLINYIKSNKNNNTDLGNVVNSN